MNLLKRIFSIQNIYIQDKKYKVFCFLGLKIKHRIVFDSTFIKNNIYCNGIRLNKNTNPSKFDFNIKGENNTIYLNDFNGNGKIVFEIDINNSEINLGKNTVISRKLSFIAKPTPGLNINNNSQICIGNNNSFNGNVTIGFTNETYIKIGNENLFASVQFRVSNSHLIYDIITMNKININKGISIGNRNWICSDVIFFDKTVVQNNCVVGAFSLVNKSFNQNNILIAGIPAQKKRDNIMWHISLDDSYKETDNPLEFLNV